MINNNLNNKLSLNWITGFTDAEGCFMINITKRKTNKIKWQVYPRFQIGLHTRDKDLLLNIKRFFKNVGNNYINNNVASYQVNKLNDIINIIIPRFENYPLITQKQSDFIIFKSIVNLMNKNEHLTKDGLIKITNLKAFLNKGLSDELKVHFPNIINMKISKENILINIDYNWMAGFFSGDGCLFIRIRKAIDHKIGYRVELVVTITQHYRDKLLLETLVNILKCGGVYKRSSHNTVDLVISNFEDIYYKIIPIFNKFKIIGIKSLDYYDFVLAA